MKNLLRRMSGFALLPALSILASLVLLPLIAKFNGPPGWSALALGQSLGALVSIVAGLAWPVVGAQRVIDAKNTEAAARIFALSLATRGFLILLSLTVAVPIAVLVADNAQIWTVLAFLLGTSLNGLSASWYFAGAGNPWLLVRNEGLTRLSGYLVAIAAVMVTHAVLAYGLTYVFFSLLSVVLNWLTIVKGKRNGRVTFGEMSNVYREQFSGALSQFASSLHSFAPPSLLSVFVPEVLAAFTAIDGVFKAGCNAVIFLPSSLIQWIYDDRLKSRRRRWIATEICVGIAFSIIVVWSFIGVIVLRILYQDKLAISYFGNAIIGVSVAAVLIVNMVELLWLVPEGKEHLVFRVGLWSSLLGVAAVVPLAYGLGWAGGFLTYLGVCIVKLFAYGVDALRHPD